MSQLSEYLERPNQNFAFSYLQIRKAVGWLGILLPVALVIGTRLFSNCPHIKDSISDYFYTIMGSVLVGVLCAVALFLFSYNGYNNWDKIASNIAALFALGVAFFPVSVNEKCNTCTFCNILSRDVSHWRNIVHFGSATIFFLTLALMSIFLFTKTDKPDAPGTMKLRRNLIYRICGIIIISAMITTGVLDFLVSPDKQLIPHATLWLETIMLWAFGFSWLIKGETLWKD